MGKQSRTNPRRQAGGALFLIAAALALVALAAFGQAGTPLLLPGGLVYDAQGSLYFSETGHHLVRKLTPGGVLSVVAGTGTQGYGGDGGQAVAAQLDSPGALAVDAAGNLLIADTHNHRVRLVDAVTGIISTVMGNGAAGLGTDGIAGTASPVDLPSALAFNAAGDLYFADARRQVVRRLDHATGLVTTVAGNGVEGAQGDGGQARSASLDYPSGLAFNPAGDLLISDAHNQRVRRVDVVTGLITTVAGIGVPGYSEGVATAAALRLPRGLTVDAPGNLFLVDAGNNRIRRVDAGTGQMTTIAGAAVQGFAGDGASAVQAALDSPRAVVLSPAGLPTLADTANARVRQVDASGAIHTIAGVGAVVPAGLLLSGPATAVYGGERVSATLGGAAGSGSVTLLEGTTVLGSAALVGNVATFSPQTLPAGAHVLTATFAGDSTHGALQSNALHVLLTPAPVLATPLSVTQVYGLTLPQLSGTLAGVLAQDAGAVRAGFASTASAGSAAGVYPISATISGAAAGNYALSTVPAAVTISRAPSSASLSGTLLAHVASSTSGQPGGSITLLDGGTAFATLAVTSSGDAQFSSAGLSNGSHTLSASYAGDVDFLPSSSVPLTLTVGTSAAADFALASAGTSSVSVPAGSAAVFSFAETPVNGGLSSPILLAASGLPAGATATFSPAYLPPGGAPQPFTLTVQTIKTASVRWTGTLLVAGFVAWLVLPRARRRVGLAGLLSVGLVGCGDRVTPAGQGTVSRTYNITVNATATGSSGGTLLHSVVVTLTTE